MPYIGNNLATQFQAFVTQTITGDGSTGYTLDRAVANGKELLVYINNVKQEEGSSKSYTASGTTITFSEAVTSDDSCYVVFLGSAVQTVTAPDASIVSGQLANANLEMPNTLDMNGKELILDADADTSITADTDDTIDVKVGGTDTIKVTGTQTDIKVSASRELNILKDSSDDFLVLKSTAPDASNNLRTIELVGETISFATGASSGTSSTERGRFDNSGRLLIGTTSTLIDGDQVLQVKGCASL